MEPITSRPLVPAAVGKAAKHAGQTALYLIPRHGKPSILRSLIANIRAALQLDEQVAAVLDALDVSFQPDISTDTVGGVCLQGSGGCPRGNRQDFLVGCRGGIGDREQAVRVVYMLKPLRGQRTGHHLGHAQLSRAGGCDDLAFAKHMAQMGRYSAAKSRMNGRPSACR